ncbi:diguanylate cyclase [Hahella aquimaris]|uniref:diguanylate cyclase domain-containing protein n=1 Tax=Hahella sp. HNIBRBA332 TaxID=3015983 RepID=UPI00273BA3C7|nr:diguanylate cyclase [Hahella sp. HNIBRBA332]WLQ15443.1 diguanylate cyclase [Hahella sp. HNIBRBA332]
MNLGIRTLLSLTLAGIVFITTSLVNGIVDYEASRRLRNELGEQYSELAYQMADRLDRAMFERLSDMINVSSLPTIRNLNGSQAELQRNILETLKRTYGYYAWIGLTDVNGVVLRATGGLMEGADVSGLPWWKEGHLAPYVGDVRDSELLDRYPRQGDPTQPLRIVDFAAPILGPEGAPIGVMGAHLNWDWVKEAASSLLQQRNKDIELLVLSKDGDVLLAPENTPFTKVTLPDSLRGNETHIMTWPDGQKYLTGFSGTKGFLEYSGLGWTVIARREVSQALGPVRRLSAAIWMWGGSITIIFAMIGWMMAARISRPLRELAASAEAIERTDSQLSYTESFAPREIRGLAAALRDMLEKLRNREETLRRQYSELQMLYEGSPVGIAMIGQDLNCLRINTRLADWFELDNAQVVGRNINEISSELMEWTKPVVLKVLASGSPELGIEMTMKESSAGKTRHFLASCLPLFEEKKASAVGVALLISEMTAQRQAEYFATHDTLTGLPNRRFLSTFITQELAVARRQHKKVAALYLDLDRFKDVNDNHGHDIGDTLLQEVTRRLRQVVRESDLIVRLGGDEFVVVLLDIKGVSDVTRLAESIINSLSAPYVLDGVEVRTSPSIGIAVYPDDVTGESQLLSCADEAMYEAKKNGPGQYRYYVDLHGAEE